MGRIGSGSVRQRRWGNESAARGAMRRAGRLCARVCERTGRGYLLCQSRPSRLRVRPELVPAAYAGPLWAQWAIGPGRRSGPTLGAVNLSHPRHNCRARARTVTSLVPATTTADRRLKTREPGRRRGLIHAPSNLCGPEISAHGDAGQSAAPRACRPGRRCGQSRVPGI